MNHKVLILLVAATLSVPAAVAGWGSRGEFEPSTSYDRDEIFMFPEPNTEKQNAVYFNAYAGACVGYIPAYCTTINANAAALGSARQSYPYRALALLGVWRDCNDDGYMGYGEQGLLEYPSQLLTVPNANGRIVGTSICPVESLPTFIPRNWMPVHNDGRVVREFLPIGWDSNPGGDPPSGGCPTNSAIAAPCNDINPFNINDSGARVWGDWDEPGDSPGKQCYVRPHPHGTWHSIGGLRAYADCHAGGRVLAAIDAAQLRPAYETVKGSNCDDSYILTGYTVGCNPWGETKQASHVDAFDCQKDNQLHQSPQYIDVNGNGKRDSTEPNLGSTVNVSHPRPTPGVTLRGSIAGTLNETATDFDDCRENSWGDAGGSGAPYSLEGSLQNMAGRRFKTDQALAYVEGARPAPPVVLSKAVYGHSGGEDFGTGVYSYEGVWVGGSITAASRNPFLKGDTGNPMPVTYKSFYAYISPAADKYNLVLPSSTVGSYGSEACTDGHGPGKPEKNGWVCDDTLWWPVNEEGARTMPRTSTSMGEIEYGVKVGQPYQLRDVDCWDESIDELRREGVHWGVVSGTTCA